jgi:tetratricopeptide (TPR) repeat protein
VCELSGWQSDRYVATLAAAWAEAGDFALAVQWQEKAVDLCARAGGKSGVSEAWLRYNLRLLKSGRGIREGALAGHGRYLLANGEYDKAETQLNRVLNVSRRHLGESHAETCGCILTLIELYEAWDKPAEAEKWRSQLAVHNRALE